MPVKKLFICLVVFLMTCPLAFAQNDGNTKLMEILQSKGILSPEDIKNIQNSGDSNTNVDAAAQDMMLEILQKKGLLTDQEVAAISEAGDAPPTLATKSATPSADIIHSYDNGFCLKTRDESASLCLKGLLQVDYRAYDYDLKPGNIGTDPGSDKFDIRRARLITTGTLPPFIDCRLSYEFQGAGTRRLLDAYVDARIHDAFVLRLGQFKEPFGLEALSPDKDLFFSERSMGYDLNPARDVGLMAHGKLWSERF